MNFAKARRRSSARERERRPSTVKFKAATFGKYRRPRTRSKARGTNEKVSSPFDVFRRVSTTTRPAQKLALPCAAPLVNDTQGGMESGGESGRDVGRTTEQARAGGREGPRESCVREGDQADGFHIHTSTGAHRLYARLIRNRAEPLVRTSVHPFANPLGSRGHNTRGIDCAHASSRGSVFRLPKVTHVVARHRLSSLSSPRGKKQRSKGRK